MNSPKKKIIIIIATFFLISFCIEFFIILPTLNDIKQMNADIQKEKNDLEQKFRKGQFIKKVIADYKEAEPKKEILDSIFIQKGQELTFISELENIAQKYNLQPDFIKLNGNNTIIDSANNEKKEDFFDTMPLKITLEGNYNQTNLFLAELETMPYYFNISTITMSSKNKQNIITAEIEGDAYIKNSMKK